MLSQADRVKNRKFNMQSVGLFLPVSQSQGRSQFNCKLTKSRCPTPASDIYCLLMQPKLNEILASTKELRQLTQ